MKKKEHQKENTEVILNSIISANKNLFMKIKEQFPSLTTIQKQTVLLLELGYNSNEIKIILGATDKSIVNAIYLTSNTVFSLD